MFILNGKEYKSQEEYNLDVNKAMVDAEKKAQEISIESAKVGIRVSELQDKAIIEGLTDREKKEYKELRGL